MLRWLMFALLHLDVYVTGLRPRFDPEFDDIDKDTVFKVTDTRADHGKEAPPRAAQQGAEEGHPRPPATGEVGGGRRQTWRAQAQDAEEAPGAMCPSHRA